MTKTLFALSLFGALFVGCVTNTVTNLTATTQPRDPTGLYRVEYEWDTTQQTVRPESINRWEAFIPVPASKDQVIYQFKVDYEFTRFGKPGQASKLSPEYKLNIK